MPLADDSICLLCASPLSTNCGFSNFSLCQVAGSSSNSWRLEMQPCTCEQCERYSTESANQNDLQDGMARERLLERHRFSKLDRILGVDEPLASVRLRPANRVPLLVLRLMIADDGAELGVNYDLEALDEVLRSFEQTTAFVATERGQALLRTRVFERARELELLHQITVPPVVVKNAVFHYYYCAALLRVVVITEHIERLTRDLRFGYDTNATVQRFVLNLQLFADTHLDLFVTCDAMGGLFNDAWLTMPTSHAVSVNLPPLAENASAADVRARKELQRKALMAESIYFTPLERAYPHPLRAVFAGEMINFGNSLLQSNIWTTVSEVSMSETARCLHVLLGKAANHKCLKRNIDSMLSEEIGSQPVLVPFVHNLLETTQLGNYPGPRFRPKWRARLCIRRSYHWERFELNTWCAACHKGVRAACPKCAANEGTSIDGKKSTASHADHLCDVCAFLRHQKYLVFFAIKEFYVFSVRSQGLINTMLEQESGWIEHCSLLLHALDDARRIMSSAFTDRRNANPDVVRKALWRASRHLILMHDCNKPTMRRLYKSPYLYDQMLAKMHRYHRASLVVSQWTGCQQPEDFLVAPLLRDAGDPGAFPLDKGGDEAVQRFYACDERLEHLGGARWCDVYTLEVVEKVAAYCVAHLGGDIVPSMLIVVGMSPAGHALLANLCFKSTVRDMPDNKLYKECRKIGTDAHMTDFHLLHYFLRMMKKKHAISHFALDVEQTENQRGALYLRNKIDPWGVLPPDTHHVAVCRNDEQVFATIVEAADADEMDAALAKDGSALTLDAAIFARGVTSAFYDHSVGGLVCPRDVKSANAKRWRKFDMQRAMWLEGASKSEQSDALSIRTSLENKRECTRHPLEWHSLLGSVLIVGHHALTLCVKCGAVCYFQDTCMTQWGMTCGREVRFAERDRYSALQQFATRQTHALRNADDNGLFEVRETILLAPPSHGKRDRRADLFDRITTPVFDQSRGYQQLLFINAMSAAPRLLLNNGDKLMREDVTYLLDNGDDEDGTDGVVKPGSEPGSVMRSRASRPRTSRKQKEIVTDDLPEAERSFAVSEEAHEDGCECGCEDVGVGAEEVFSERPRDSNDDYVIPMKLSERQDRAAVPFAERHHAKPHNYSDVEWAALTDDVKLFAWMNEGRFFRDQFLALKQRPVETTARTLPELMLREDDRRARLRDEGYYERELARMRAIDECVASEARSRRTLLLDNFSDAQIDTMRQKFTECGWLEARHDIVCAYCKIVCDPRGQYKRVSVINLDGMLVNPLTKKPIEERGVVQIWLCNAEFRHVERMLREKELPLASDVFILIDSRRQRARVQAMRNHGGKR